MLSMDQLSMISIEQALAVTDNQLGSLSASFVSCINQKRENNTCSVGGDMVTGHYVSDETGSDGGDHYASITPGPVDADSSDEPDVTNPAGDDDSTNQPDGASSSTTTIPANNGLNTSSITTVASSASSSTSSTTISTTNSGGSTSSTSSTVSTTTQKVVNGTTAPLDTKNVVSEDDLNASKLTVKSNEVTADNIAEVASEINPDKSASLVTSFPDAIVSIRDLFYCTM